MKSLVSVTDGASSRHHSMMRIVDMVFDEAMEELEDLQISDAQMAAWIFWFGRLFQWCANGDTEDMPDDMKEIVSAL
jgi:hypothetical protein